MNVIQGKIILAVKVVLFVALLSIASSTYAATLSISPSTGVYTAGQTFTARIVVNTSGKKINAAEGTLSFKTNELSVVRVTKGSVFNLWTSEPTFSNSAGTISFSGGTPAGYSGSAGTVLSVTFRAKGAGTPKVSFSSGAVLAADGRGTNILTSMNGGTFTIAAAEVIPQPETIEYIAPANTPAAPIITSVTHPDMDSWFASDQAELSWDIPSGVIAVRTLLDENSGSIPTKVYSNPISSITLSDLEQGVQYFHLQFKNSEGWGRVTHYRLAVDMKKPTAFDIRLAEGADLSNPSQTLLLSTEDDTSKVTKFIVQIDAGEAYEFIDVDQTKELILPPLEPGRHSVIIEAFDEAGNSIIGTFSFTILAFDKPQFIEFPTELSQGVIPVIKGITRPNSSVQLSVTKIGSDTQTITIQSSDSGEFIYIPESRFSLGVYELTAIAIDEYGAQSEVSDTIRIAVQEPGYIQIGSFVVSLLSIIIPLIALTGILIFGAWFLGMKIRRMRKGVSLETHEALEMLHAEFGTLRNVLNKESKTLSSSRKTKKLTKGEVALVQALQNALSSAQKNLEKEISDVENIVE